MAPTPGATLIFITREGCCACACTAVVTIAQTHSAASCAVLAKRDRLGWQTGFGGFLASEVPRATSVEQKIRD